MRIFLTLLLTLPRFLAADPLTVLDDPWIGSGDAMIWSATGYEMADIVAMADLDGDPTTITADEQAMIDLLSQVLGATPISTQSGS